MLLGLAIFPATSASAQSSLREGFESPEPGWRDLGSDMRYQVEMHLRTGEPVRSGTASEYIQLTAPAGGTYIHWGFSPGHARIIAELTASVWVRSNRADLQLLGRVVLPRTIDPRTGQPIARLIAGSSYTQVGRWQQLRLADPVGLLASQARYLRTELETSIDVREAFLDQIVINAYGGAGRTRLWIDDLELTGFVPAAPGDNRILLTAGDGASASLPDRTAAMPAVELSGSVLLSGGRPQFPRIIEYRGEPLAFLQQLGFNAVKTATVPSPTLLEEATREGMWLVSPPPRPANLGDPNAQPASLGEFDARYDPLLAWHLGQGLSARELDSTRQWAEQIRRADGRRTRPLVCDADAELRAYSRAVGAAGILLTHRFPLGTGFELTDYGTWLRQRARLARPGTPMWTTIQTELAPELVEQVAMLSRSGAAPPVPESEQVRLLVHSAVAAGARGLLFASSSPLDAADPAARQRAMLLELINLELDLIQPWTAAGSVAATVAGSDPAGAASGVLGAVLQTQRSRLLLPIFTGRGSQFVPGQSAANSVAFLVPGVPEDYDAYEVTPGGLRPLVRQRKAGGMLVTLDEFSVTSTVLLTDDPRAISSLTHKLAQAGPKAARLERDLVVQKLQRVAETDRRLNAASRGVAEAGPWLAGAQESVRSADAQLADQDYLGAYLHARRAARPLRMLQRAHWERAVASLSSPIASPFAVSFATLPWHWTLMSEIEAARRPAGTTSQGNRLVEGGFENLERMIQSGWRHLEYPQPGVVTEAELSPSSPHGGSYSLRLAARSADLQSPPGLIEAAPLWITTPGINVAAEELVRIHGWVRIPTPISSSLDGLMIIDSLGGEALAERIGETSDWREFTLLRACPADGQVTVTLALTGLGEAWIDDLTVEAVPRRTPASAAMAPAIRRSSSRPMSQSVRRSQQFYEP